LKELKLLKDPAARIFGQNAFTGAINIVTKKRLKNKVSIKRRNWIFWTIK
jgi:iron complex outermembrane receptor protein